MINQFKIAEAKITKVETLLAKKWELDSFQKNLWNSYSPIKETQNTFGLLNLHY